MQSTRRRELLEKIKEWQKKARRESDPFNKYISMFIAYNIFYNLYAKTRNPSADFASGDRKRAIATLSLLPSPERNQLFYFIKSHLEDYGSMIPIFREEYWPSSRSPQRVALSETLKRALKENDADMAIEMLLKWLYKVRCNLVHGEKSYKDTPQRKLLEKSSFLLDKVLESLIDRYLRAYKTQNLLRGA